MARIGALALQGGYDAHLKVVERLGHEGVRVREAAQLDTLDGLILPGGESTTHLKLIDRFGLEQALVDFVASGKPVLATCAGLILSAQSVRDPEQRSFGWLDVTVSRNAWGRQVHSFEASTDETVAGLEGLPLVFIRAPRLQRVGDDVEVLARIDGEPIMVRQGNVVGASFHPELTDDVRVHSLVFS
ncbi:MAG: pyridoxal 5'-phosphate synthase glutaminase subunit PdxT [Bradymonadia bacterium]